MNKNIPVVILCGGRGTRLDPHTRLIPKSLIKIGQEPILHHIMKIYSYQGFNNFILCLGHLGKRIREYFKGHSNWEITFVDTGMDTNTGGRIKQIERYIKGKTFMATYGDGLADVNLRDLLSFHRAQGKITNREYQKLCAGVNRETIRKDLNDLINRKIIIRKGEKKGVYYELI